MLLYLNLELQKVVLPKQIQATAMLTIAREQIIRCIEEIYEHYKDEMIWIEFDLKVHPSPSIHDRIKQLETIEVSHGIIYVMQVIAAMEPVRQAGNNNIDEGRKLGEADYETYFYDVYKRILNVDDAMYRILVNFITALLIQVYDSDNWSKLYTDTEEGRKIGEEKYKVDTESIREFLEYRLNRHYLENINITIAKFRDTATVLQQQRYKELRAQESDVVFAH
ncbi:unnamed protein product [Cylicocyclus nassatus]|uniref:Uncharacterized protein n=1 Tax=Cylicocyclus nassatus TaxID=53992 RepID=A0AA36GDL6_CYLNA|nr:unnamed protein product [Cylicocyclus nassatus]